jgi:hypothetical protein
VQGRSQDPKSAQLLGPSPLKDCGALDRLGGRATFKIPSERVRYVFTCRTAAPAAG